MKKLLAPLALSTIVLAGCSSSEPVETPTTQELMLYCTSEFTNLFFELEPEAAKDLGHTYVENSQLDNCASDIPETFNTYAQIDLWVEVVRDGYTKETRGK